MNCVMLLCQGFTRCKSSEFFPECTIELYEMEIHNNSSFSSSVFMSGGGILSYNNNEIVDMATVIQRGDDLIFLLCWGK